MKTTHVSQIGTHHIALHTAAYLHPLPLSLQQEHILHSVLYKPLYQIAVTDQTQNKIEMMHPLPLFTIQNWNVNCQLSSAPKQAHIKQHSLPLINCPSITEQQFTMPCEIWKTTVMINNVCKHRSIRTASSYQNLCRPTYTPHNSVPVSCVTAQTIIRKQTNRKERKTFHKSKTNCPFPSQGGTELTQVGIHCHPASQQKRQDWNILSSLPNQTDC